MVKALGSYAVLSLNFYRDYVRTYVSYLEEEGSLGETSDEGLVFVLGDHTIQNEVIAWLVPSPSLVGSHTGKDILDWLRWL